MSKRICFMHIPKCAGSSIQRAIRNPLTPWNYFRYDSTGSVEKAKESGMNLHAFREQDIRHALDKNRYKYITGHFRCSSRLLSDYSTEWSFITLLRNPVDRWLSHYHYNRYKEKSHFKTEDDLETYLETSGGIAAGSMFVRFLSSAENTRSSEAIEDAKQALERFDLVGRLEDLNAFASSYHELFNRPLRIKRYNENPFSFKSKGELSAETLRKIEEICSPDLEVYRSVFPQ